MYFGNWFKSKKVDVAFTALIEPNAKESNVGAHVKYYGSGLDFDAVSQVALDVVIEHHGFVLVDAEYPCSVRQLGAIHGHENLQGTALAYPV